MSNEFLLNSCVSYSFPIKVEALQAGNLLGVLAALRAGADANVRDANSETPLFEAVARDDGCDLVAG